MNGERRDITIPDVVSRKKRTTSYSSVAECSSVGRILKKCIDQVKRGDEYNDACNATYGIDAWVLSRKRIHSPSLLKTQLFVILGVSAI